MNDFATGVPGLDQVLGGGLLPGSSTVLVGPTGTGKTIMAQQICFANATAGHRAVYYTTISEPTTKLMEHLEQFTFFSRDRIGTEVEFVHLGDLLRREPAGNLEVLVSEVVRKAMEESLSVVAIDSVTVLRDFTGAREMRLALYDLVSRMAHTGAALVTIGDYPPGEVAVGAEFALADNIMQLAYEPHEPIDLRWARAVKVRGRRHLTGKHTLSIDAGGCKLFPRVESLGVGRPAEVTGRIPSGIPGLDERMGGGIGANEATIVLGPSGVSKTIFGLQFVTEGVARQERCLYVTFQDTAEQLVKMAAVFGWDLRTAWGDGRLVIHHVPADELDLDMLVAHIRDELAQGGVHRVVIDSLAEMVFAARESQRFPAYARNLIGLLRNAGVTLLVTSETTLLGPTREPANGIMFLFHNVILLRYIELDSATGRALSIIKMRNSDHSQQLHQLDVGPHGISLGPPLERASGTLGWTALRVTSEQP